MKVPSPQSEVKGWKPLELLVSTAQDLYTTVCDTLGGQGIGMMDIIPWLAGEGKKAFVEKLEALGTEFNNTRRIRLTGNKNVIWVNLDAPLKLPFGGAKPKPDHDAPSGWVRVELKKDSLYVNRKKIVAYVDGRQDEGSGMQGYKLADALTGKSVEHPNILDALLKFPHLVPDELKKDVQGRTIYLHFWAVKFRNSNGDLYVRYGFWDRCEYHSDHHSLKNDWDCPNPAAVRASPAAS